MAPVNSMAAAAVPKQSASNKDENQSSGSRKAAAAVASSSSSRPQELPPALKCPRCDSQNTKFCYYNNYSLTQPRHFCKTCRRYWTKGGALRNVPIGGGCRKNKKVNKSSSSATATAAASRLISNLDNKDMSGNIVSSTDINGLKFYHGITAPMDFQLGALGGLPRLPTGGGFYSQFSSFGDMVSTTSSSGFSLELDPSSSGRSANLMGFNFPFTSMLKQGEINTTQTTTTAGGGGGFISGGGREVQEIGSLNHHHHHYTSLATSIESLSSINQDLHWKLQQQRLAMLFGGDQNQIQQKESNNLINISSLPLGNHHEDVPKPQPILFHNLETPKTNASSCGGVVSDHDQTNNIGTTSRREGSGNLSTEWFFDSSYGPVTPTPTNSSSNGNDQNMNSWNNNSNNNNGIQAAAWSNMSQYSGL